MKQGDKGLNCQIDYRIIYLTNYLACDMRGITEMVHGKREA